MRRIAASALAALALALAGCAGLLAPQAVPPTHCANPLPDWNNAVPPDASDVVMWSAARWALDPDMRGVPVAVAPCGGGGPGCDAVASYVRLLGGTVVERHACAVLWDPTPVGSTP